jgi:hypothetical protein
MPVIVQNFLWLIDGLSLILTSNFNDRFDFNPLIMMTYPISANRIFLLKLDQLPIQKLKTFEF